MDRTLDRLHYKMIVDGHELKNTYVLPCGGSEDTVYFLEMKLDEEPSYIFKQYDFKSRDISTVWKGKKDDAQFIKDDTLYLKPEGINKIESYNLKTKEKEDILEWEDECSNVFTQAGYIEFINRTETDGKINDFYKWYDIKEKNIYLMILSQEKKCV